MKAIKRILLFLCIILVLFSICGCRDSAVLERIIYDYLRARQTDMEKSIYDDIEDRQPDDLLNDLSKDDNSQRENDEEQTDPVFDSEHDPITEESAGSEGFEGYENGGGTEGGGLDPNAAGNQGAFGTALTSRLVVDDYGNRYAVPENVDTVAAVGSAAVAVLMLGGVDCLAAADEALTADALAAEVFPGLSDIPALWKSGGDDTLSEDGLQRLLQIHPDLCLETSGSAMLTDAQVVTLQENGIGYVVLPAPTSVKNLKLIAQAVGRILGDHTADGGYDSVRLADEYCAWVDSTVSGVASGGETYTIYVDGWDSEAYYAVDQASGCYGYGAAVLDNGRMMQCVAVSAFLSEASVTNVTSLARFSRAETIYFTPIDGNYSTVTVSGSSAARLTPNKLLVEGNYLGSVSFQVVIAGSRSVKAGLESCELWKSFGRVTSSNGNFVDYGFLDDYGEIVRSTIAGPYTVVVNPKGIGDWAGGSVESVLEAVWAGYAIQGICSEAEIRSTVSEFYRTFYRYSLSEAQLDTIFAGEA